MRWRQASASRSTSARGSRSFSRAGTALPEPRALPAFALVDQAGRPFGRARFEGGGASLFTGFTHCPDVCPTTLALMAELNRRVARDDLQFVFLSVDPERDTPDAVARYLAHFDAALVGATARARRWNGSRPDSGSPRSAIPAAGTNTRWITPPPSC